jgi:P27 family predicted phage terminase small subunit
MKTGRKPRPTKLLKLQGTWRHDRHEDRLEPQAPGDLAREEPPAHLTEAQKARWRWALERAPANILRSIDREALTAFVVAADLVEQANAAQQLLDRGKQLPFLTKSDKGLPTLSPYVKLMLRAVPILLRAAAECGFTPTARAGMKIDDGAGKSSAAAERWALFDSLGKPKKGEAELLAAKPASAQPQ